MEKLEMRLPPPEAAQYDLPAVKRLVALLTELQRQAGSGPFFLDCRTGARLLGVDHVQVWRWFKMLVADGVLAQVEQGRTGRATRWRWLGGQH